MTVVVCHDTGCLVWMVPGRTTKTLESFFTQLEASQTGRCATITHVSADGARWIDEVVKKRCSNAL